MAKKKTAAICAAVLAVIAAAAGIYFYMNRFDAAEYVKAVLDVSYKGQTEQYMEFTGVSEKEAESIFEDNLDATMENFQSSPMKEELKPKYRELFGEIAKKVNYTVGEAQKQEDGRFLVPVKIKPVTLFQDTYAEFQEKAKEYAEQVTDSVMQGGDMPSDGEMQSEVYGIYYEVLKEGLDRGLLYGAAKETALHVTKNEKGEYEVEKEDLKKLDSLLIADAREESGEDEN